MQSWAAQSQSLRRCESDANLMKKRKRKGIKGEDRGQDWLESAQYFHPSAPAPWRYDNPRGSRPPRSNQAQPPPKLRIPRGRGSSSSSTMLCESAQSSCCTPDDNNVDGISPLEVSFWPEQISLCDVIMTIFSFAMRRCLQLCLSRLTLRTLLLGGPSRVPLLANNLDGTALATMRYPRVPPCCHSHLRCHSTTTSCLWAVRRPAQSSRPEPLVWSAVGTAAPSCPPHSPMDRTTNTTSL